jgi:hypothetical protein
MPEERFTSSRVVEILAQVQQKVTRGAGYSSGAYERDVTRLLDELFPFSVLPGIRLFSSEPRGRVAYGFEMDNLIHVRFGEADYIVIVEAKKQAIEVDKGRWNVSYDSERKCAREQVDDVVRLCSQRGFKVEFEKPRQPTPPEK